MILVVLECAPVRRYEPMLLQIMISMGGVDFQNGTEKALEAIQRSKASYTCEITQVVGHDAPWFERGKQLDTDMAQIADIKCDVETTAKIMVKSDLAIEILGSTPWERCRLGLPSMIFNIC
jgi:UDP-2,4-diacetamido-2,4,6-trideoxy-beta-L-altropyranose hydrolase